MSVKGKTTKRPNDQTTTKENWSVIHQIRCPVLVLKTAVISFSCHYICLQQFSKQAWDTCPYYCKTPFAIQRTQRRRKGRETRQITAVFKTRTGQRIWCMTDQFSLVVVWSFCRFSFYRHKESLTVCQVTTKRCLSTLRKVLLCVTRGRQPSTT